MRPLTWIGLLREGGFRIHPSRFSYFLGASLATPWNTALHWIQNLVYRRTLNRAELHGPPVFIIGHWRSGTTLLHELMVLDERYSSPSTFQCFAPHHFLITEWFFQRFFRWLLPGKRPMDNMAAGWERPQEDEFALMNLGLPSPYRHIAFPKQPPVDLDYLDFRSVEQSDVDQWLAALREFLQNVSVVTGRPLVIKSPIHTGRIAQLAQEFPDARFIHLTRDPRSLFPSTCRLWHSLADVQGMQAPDRDGFDEYVIECLQRMYEGFHEGRKSVESHRIIDVKYESLTADPVGTLETIYRSLKLSDFDSVRKVIEAWANSEHKQYKTNSHRLSADDEARIRSAWSDYFETYGY